MGTTTRSPESAFTLICLPGAGRSRAVYRGWSNLLPPDVTLLSVELPSHGYPEGMSLQARVARLRERWGRDGKVDTGKPVAVFGHSFGAVVGYELARALADRRPWLFVAAAGDPHRAPATRDSELSDDALVARLLELSDASAPLLDPDVRESFLPKIRADLRLEEDYRADPIVVDLPVTVFGGTVDPLVRPEDLQGWASVTSRPLDVHVLTGDHFFVDDHAEEICLTITRTIAGAREVEKGSRRNRSTT